MSGIPPQLNQPQEISLFDEHGVFVSNHRVIIDGQTFAVRNISSVMVEHQVIPKPQTGLWSGIVLFFIGFGFVIAGSSPSWLACILCFGIGGFLIYRHIKTKHKNNYWLCFTTNAGHSRVKGWQDEQFALNISRAINQAMMYG